MPEVNVYKIPESPVKPIEHQSAAEARQVFKREVKPADQLIQMTEDFTRALGEYRTGLNIATETNSPGSIQESAQELTDLAQQRETIRIKLKEEAGPAESAKLAEVEEKIRLQRNRIFQQFTENQGGVVTLLSRYLPESDRQNFQDLVVDNVTHWVTTKTTTAKINRVSRQNSQMVMMADFLLTNSPQFGPLREKIQENGLEFSAVSWSENEKMLTQFANTATAKRELACFDPQVKAFELRHWLTKTTEASRRGKKIFETPYYKQQIKELERMGKKKNGVGGVILYGPPGTGKTELVQEKNRQQGYETHVVSIHHYSSFSELLAEKAITLKTDQGAPLAQKLETVISHFKDVSPDRFIQTLTEVFNNLKTSGQISPDQEFSQFILPYLSLEQQGVLNILSKDPTQWAAEEKKQLQDGFIAKQESRLLRTSLAPNQQEINEDIVRGEILLAIKKSQGTGKKFRVLLDELDKAGPNSLGGILTFLAKSPGETITIGDLTETIPPWFIVDATSNSPKLDSFLSDRFSHLEIKTPPVKDQLMIAAVRLCDSEGILLLTPHEQEQVVAAFLYLIPEVNRLVTEDYAYAPLSNRSILQFTNSLVDFRNSSRTDVPVSQAVRKMVLDNKPWSKDPEIKKRLTEMLDRQFSSLIVDQPIDVYHEDPPAHQSNLGDKYNQALQETVTSPLISAINGLPEESVRYQPRSAQWIRLGPEQTTWITQVLTAASKNQIPDQIVHRLATGLLVNKKEIKGKTMLEIAFVPEDREKHDIFSVDIESGRLESVSGDAKTIVLTDTKHHDRFIIQKPLSNGAQVEIADVPETQKITIDKTGTFIGHLGKPNILSVYNVAAVGTEKDYLPDQIEDVVDFQFSQDGNLILVKNSQNQALLYSSHTLTPIFSEPLKTNPGYHWQFFDKNLLLMVPNKPSDRTPVNNLCLFLS